MKKVLLIIGMPGSGKTTAANLLGKQLNANVIHSGDIVRQEIKRKGLKLTPEVDRKMRKYFHSGREHIIVNKTIAQFKRNKLNIVDGFRSLKEVKMLKNKGYEPIIIYISAPFTTRAKRQIKRARMGKRETMSYLKIRDKDELKIGLEKLIKSADFVISNRGTLSELKESIKNFAKQINI
ncbi:MAG: nucleoside monophosphate kinase [Candidatus Aenigmarchaeota archaeon]|nr:nucleoside monophosphate kinase [Candidatus Aenigmarchaeota archaeon]